MLEDVNRKIAAAMYHDLQATRNEFASELRKLEAKYNRFIIDAGISDQVRKEIEHG